MYGSSGAPVGGEFQVNTMTDGGQTNPSVSMDASGDFVIVWQSQKQDGSGWGVSGQRFSAAGVAQGGQFLVNTTTAGDQTNPTVALDATGSFAVAWISDLPGAVGPVVVAQRDDSQGAPVGGQFQVNTSVEHSLRHPSLASDSAGDLLFTWSSRTIETPNQWNVYGRQFEASGVALGPEFQVNTSLGFNQMNSSVAMSDLGQVVVDWAGGGTLDRSGIYMQQFDITFSDWGSPVSDVLYARCGLSRK